MSRRLAQPPSNAHPLAQRLVDILYIHTHKHKVRQIHRQFVHPMPQANLISPLCHHTHTPFSQGI